MALNPVAAATAEFFDDHRDYRKGKVVEKFVPTFPTGDALFVEASLKPGENFESEIRNNVCIECVDSEDQHRQFRTIDEFPADTLDPQLMKNLARLGIESPLPTQRFLVPFLLDDHKVDLLAMAPTGFGKTLGIVLPLVQKCLDLKRKADPHRQPNAPFAVLVCASRNLAHQLTTDVMRIADGTGLKVCCAYGEYYRIHNEAEVRKGLDFVVATVGRLVDFISCDIIPLTHAYYLAVDEADKLIEDDLFGSFLKVFKLKARSDYTTTLFSATFNPAVLARVDEILNPGYIQTAIIASPLREGIDHDFLKIPLNQRLEDVLRRLIGHPPEPILSEDINYDRSDFVHPVQYHTPRTIIFCNTHRTAEVVALYLVMHGVRCQSVNAARTQGQRNEACLAFAEKEFNVITATDVVSRGLNFPDVQFVINYDCPPSMEVYVHRVGRAGRLGGTAKALTYMVPTNLDDIKLAALLVPELTKLDMPVPDWMLTMTTMVQFGGTAGGIRMG
uniref:RNA helicase n=1 Tax=Panagrellus redivivus TaxID=6233 RepID=A0A7E4W454_PANRE